MKALTKLKKIVADYRYKNDLLRKEVRFLRKHNFNREAEWMELEVNSKAEILYDIEHLLEEFEKEIKGDKEENK